MPPPLFFFLPLPLGAVLVDQYCNPLADITLDSISAQLDEIAEKVKKMLRIKNTSHPSLRIAPGELSKTKIFRMKSCVCGKLFSKCISTKYFRTIPSILRKKHNTSTLI